jgi:hypothetical protein
VDYSTNKCVTDWCSGGHCKYFRYENAKEIIDRLNKRDTLIIGFDYYLLFGISSYLFVEIFGRDYANEFYRLNTDYLWNGGVIRIKVWYNGRINVELIDGK